MLNYGQFLYRTIPNPSVHSYMYNNPSPETLNLTKLPVKCHSYQVYLIVFHNDFLYRYILQISPIYYITLTCAVADVCAVAVGGVRSVETKLTPVSY